MTLSVLSVASEAVPYVKTGGLADVRLTDGPRAGEMAKATLFPMTMDGQRLGVRLHPPHMGEHGTELLRGLGYADGDIAALQAKHVVA